MESPSPVVNVVMVVSLVKSVIDLEYTWKDANFITFVGKKSNCRQ